MLRGLAGREGTGCLSVLHGEVKARTLDSMQPITRLKPITEHAELHDSSTSVYRVTI
jgi:hypothetical protein